MKEKTRKAREAEQQRVQQAMQERINAAKARSFQREADELKAQDATSVDDVQPETVQNTVEKVCVECGQTFHVPSLGSHIRKICDTCKADPVTMRRRSTEAKQRSRAKEEALQAAKGEGKPWWLRVDPELEEFWKSNRATLSEVERTTYQKQHDYVEALASGLFQIIDAVKGECADPEFEALILEVVKAGTIHMYYVKEGSELPTVPHSKEHPELPPHTTWTHTEFWKDAELMSKLESENEVTRVYTRYGFAISFPNLEVSIFLIQKAGYTYQQAMAILGYA